MVRTTVVPGYRLLPASISAPMLMLYVCIWIAVFDNLRFWQAIIANSDKIQHGVYISASYIFITVLILWLLSLVFSNRWVIKPAAIVLLFTCATIGFFNKMGIVIDRSMIENILATDWREASELSSLPLFLHWFLFAVLPSIFVLRVKLKPTRLWQAIQKRALISAVLLVVAVALPLTNFQTFSFFSRQHKNLQVYANPVYPLLAVKGLIKRRLAAQRTFETMGVDAIIDAHTRKRVGIFVVGETARADHFGINGYARDTTPNLQNKQAVSLKGVESCGTSTAFSVPCMFSFLNRENYEPILADYQSNVLDVLETAGVKTLWRDNNSSCKGVCNRIESENFRENPNPNSKWFHVDQFFDEVLLQNLQQKIDSTNQDILIVLHPLGSHGPAYHKRYPATFAKFQPACENNAPQNCTQQEVINAYDNTIAYTDYLLGELITLLEKNAQTADGFLLYVSDHGESLGENGIYLHGLPRQIAPEAQTNVPFIFWSSSKYFNVKATQDQCEHQSASHDNISHTLLGLFNVSTNLYNADLDLSQQPCSKSKVAYAR